MSVPELTLADLDCPTLFFLPIDPVSGVFEHLGESDPLTLLRTAFRADMNSFASLFD